MQVLANILIALIALEHLYIVWMEMFAWETAGKKTFGSTLPDQLFQPTKGLAANQGLYNGFLVAGLVWSFVIADPIWANNIRLFFLGCISIAGIYGGLTSSRKIYFVQAMPAIIGIILVLVS
ncbi:DUF1304 domain-containing protein [uncultured Sunxiuqinia sp.]|uniref:DUF1304 domain-containing protein n=1 Tax=uncultured Sunxiuqinia sp. TaxID=1573825 RepID=UPI002AA843A0|nr:DUF1304 domain-containing protein [uncultured Sunxiuqinia sp.]